MRNLSGQLLHDLGKQIVNGDILPGETLPKVEVLSEQRGVSRTVVREALKGLTARRLVGSSTKVGTVVLERSEWQWWDPDVLTWAAESKDRKDFLLRLTEVRLAIEPAAVQTAANNATEEDIKNIRACYEKLKSATHSAEEWATADYEFHNSIFLATHNELILSLVKTLRNALVQSRHSSFGALKEKEKEPNEGVLLQHKAVMDAVCNRNDTLAYQKMYELLTRVGELLKTDNMQNI